MTNDSTLCKLNNDIAARDHAHVDQTERLRDALAIVVERQVLVIGFHVLSHFVFNPLKSNSLLEHSLMESLSLALLFEKQLHVITSNGSLKLFLSRLAICVG